MALKKQHLKTKSLVKVTFRLDKAAALDAENVSLVGDFNEWNVYATPMKRLKGGSFKVDVSLEPGKSYEYRYLIDETNWENDWDADRYVRSTFGNCDNSVVDL
ncbi:isoamylase early set domain-containing protein [Desulfovibrio ferrophilus]|uniref:Glycoside hydrolase, family 13-like protein n=1 Tax=Desulfovibrio ferrophilus TaxID=241368 RepID=A0A2Z6AXM3_9BACT|nr:isoamylase early set domain-containing protein [Desulfovibrio ferrophilus]BBD08004.1 glycoside hydrolase, family 13-like protein [Desulfovibrio ferrophilus]